MKSNLLELTPLVFCIYLYNVYISMHISPYDCFYAPYYKPFGLRHSSNSLEGIDNGNGKMAKQIWIRPRRGVEGFYIIMHTWLWAWSLVLGCSALVLSA